MTVTYEPPLTRSSAQVGEALLQEPITEGPAYVRGPRSSRWHRVRSGTRRLREDWQTGEVTIDESFHLWCGPVLFARAAGRWAGGLLFVDDCPRDEPACGTCEGRAIGADRDRPEWLFSPTSLATPAKCPGSRSMLVREDQSRWNRATCLVCGDVVAMRASGGPYNPHWGSATHEPGPGLIPGCPWHAWRELTTALDDAGQIVVACRCQTVERSR